MVTDRIRVMYDDDESYEKIVKEAERLADYENYGRKDTLRLLLLTEETLGMIRGITEGITADIWFEGDDSLCKVHVRGRTEMSRSKYEELMSLSSTGSNTLAKGLMGKISEVIQLTFMAPGDLNKTAVLNYGMLMPEAEEPSYAFHTLQCNLWSLQQYRQSLFDEKDSDNDNAQAWDELEKSIVGNLADDIQIGIDHGEVDVTIIRKLEHR